jgi:cell division septum initiation protein DivIVA
MDDTLRLLDELQMLAIDDPRKIIGSLTIGLNKTDIQDHIDAIRKSLPLEIHNASNNVKQSVKIKEVAMSESQETIDRARKDADRMIAEAQTESDKIIELARVQQERMVSESEILKQSKAQAEEIRNSAENEAKRIRIGADKYAAELLNKLDMNVDRIAGAVKNARNELAQVEAASQVTYGSAVVNTSQRTRV